MNYIEVAPVVGERIVSAYEIVPNLSLPELDSSEVALTAGYFQTPAGPLQFDPEWADYKHSFGWDIDKGPRLKNLGSELLRFARHNSFDSFRDAKLGVVIEMLQKQWTPVPEYTDPDTLDALPHLDWSSRAPTLIVLGATPNPTVNCCGEYTYKGDLADEKGTISYHEELKTGVLKPSTTDSGELQVADARRLVHARPYISKESQPFTRKHLRAFVSVANN